MQLGSLLLCPILLLGSVRAQGEALFPELVKGPSWLGEARRLADGGQFTAARKSLLPHLDKGGAWGWAARWEVERMRRVALDFHLDEKEMLAQLGRSIPDLTREQILDWQRKGTLRAMTIDGQVRYFDRAAPSLFIMESAARARRQTVMANGRAVRRLAQARKDLAAARRGERYVNSVRLRVRYRLTVKAGALPPGARLKCWLPYPRRSARQRGERLLSTKPLARVIAPTSAPQRTIYLEQNMPARGPAVFEEIFEYRAYASVVHLEAKKARALDPRDVAGALAPWLAPRAPHVVFSPGLKALAAKLKGEEKNPLVIARNIFAWMQENIPWAPAREYSTFRCIPERVLQQGHGDCGMQALFMITLLRICGIPARWQSGWTVGPDGPGMHDWLRFYVEPWGWVHADPSRGFIKGGDEKCKWFYLGNLDAYRLVVADNWGMQLHPARSHFRAEPVDFQRGEVEWEGGGLYFDSFTRKFDLEVLD